ncbi:MAG: N-acetyltransferase family protein [Bryobacterales bacterium]
MQIAIVPLVAEHWPEVRRIYEEGIATGQATFETGTPEWEAFDAGKTQDCRLAALDGECLAGWAALSPFSSRPVYRGVAEASVYVAADARGRGLGSRLLAALIEESERCGFWTLLAKIFPENTASMALVSRFGFREVGRLERRLPARCLARRRAA